MSRPRRHLAVSARHRGVCRVPGDPPRGPPGGIAHSHLLPMTASSFVEESYLPELTGWGGM